MAGLPAGLPAGLVNARQELEGGEPGVKAPARWPGQEQNTDPLSLESSTTAHAAPGRGAALCPLRETTLFSQTPSPNPHQ